MCLSFTRDAINAVSALFPPGQTAAKLRRRTLPDFEGIRRQLQQHRDLSLELLWEEYRQHHPDGYCYIRFCRLYRRWRKQQDLVARPVFGAGAVRLVPMQGGVDTVLSIVETVSV